MLLRGRRGGEGEGRGGAGGGQITLSTAGEYAYSNLSLTSRPHTHSTAGE